jgi:hypothetical protein
VTVAVTFRTQLEQGGNAVGIVVPENIMAKLGPGKRYPVVVTIGDYSYRNTVGWYKGAFRVGVSAENRAAAGVAGGDEVDVTLELDDAPRVLELPEELSLTLRDAGVLDKFTALSYSKQRGFVEPWAAARTQETRDKNLAKMLAALA